jgi:hypothetical protein
MKLEPTAISFCSLRFGPCFHVFVKIRLTSRITSRYVQTLSDVSVHGLNIVLQTVFKGTVKINSRVVIMYEV